MTQTMASAASEVRLAEIARRAEGLRMQALPPQQRLQEPAVRQRWLRWLRYGGGNDWRQLRCRMRAEGLRPAAVFQARPRAGGAAPLPPWCATLERIMAAARALAGAPDQAAARLPPGAAELPFAGLLTPCLVVGRERLAACAPPSDDAVCAADACAGLERALLQRLAEVAGPCLLALFDGRRRRPPFLALLLGQGAAPCEQYADFVQATLADGYGELAQRWPVLARLLAEIVESWADNCHEFLTRLHADHAALRRHFFADAPSAPLAAVGATLSDPHAGGRTVLQLQFADSGQLVYKPRPMEMEAIFSAALDWLNREPASREGASVEIGARPHYVPRVLTRADYGWMEWIAAAPMRESETAAYHWRLGSLLGLYRALNGIDLHLENLVAAGAHPVFVDVECMLHPSAQPFLAAPSVPQPAWSARAVLGTGALPLYGFARDGGQIHNMGAIGSAPSGGGPEILSFRHANSDWMSQHMAAKPLPTEHQPRTAAGWVDSLRYRDAIAAGFEHTLALVAARRDWLLDDPASPWAGLRQARGRHLARTTWNYGLLLGGASAPEALTDGVMFDLSFEPLHRHLALLSPGYRALAPAERLDLRRLDVPRFGFAGDSLQVYDAYGRPLAPMYARTPFDTMAAALRALTARDIAWEAQVLRQVLWPQTPPSAADAGQPPLRRATAALLARHLQAPDGASLWLGLGDEGDGLRVRAAGAGLYNGTAGIALALAAAAHAAGDADAARVALASLQPALEYLAPAASAEPGDVQPLAQLLARRAPGYDAGVAGTLFAVRQCARLCGDAALAARARQLALHWASGARLEPMLDGAAHFDLLNGAAGLLLVLLDAAQSAPAGEADALRAAARRCGDFLLATARREGDGLSWAGAGMPGLSGLSHGASGCAVALAALYRASADARYLHAAHAALAYEATLYHPQRRNWRDLRVLTEGSGRAAIDAVQQCGCSWCHGAPGIALVRAALLHLLGAQLDAAQRARLEEELGTALDTTRAVLARETAVPIDDLCCGSAGCIDILLECGRLLARPQLIAEARHEAQRRLALWSRPDGEGAPRYWFSGKALAGVDLSLFKGIAGWVYLQARLAAPDAVPCVLLPLAAATVASDSKPAAAAHRSSFLVT